MDVNLISARLNDIEERIHKLPSGVQPVIYFSGFILVLVGLLPGAEFGTFSIPSLNSYARLGAGIVGAPLVVGFILLLLKTILSEAIVVCAAGIGVLLLVLVVWSAFAPPVSGSVDTPQRTQWVFVSQIHRAVLSGFRANHPSMYSYLKDELKYYLDSVRAAGVFRQALDEDATIPLQVYTEQEFGTPFVFVTGRGQSGGMVFDWLSHDVSSIESLDIRVVIALIAYRDTSIVPAIVTVCMSVSCNVGTVADQAAVFVYPLDAKSRDVVNRVVDRNR